MGDDDAALHAVVCERKDGARFCASQKSDVQCGNHQEPSTVWPARAAARGVDERRHARGVDERRHARGVDERRHALAARVCMERVRRGLVGTLL